MKNSYIIVLLVIVVIGLVFLFSNNNDTSDFVDEVNENTELETENSDENTSQVESLEVDDTKEVPAKKGVDLNTSGSVEIEGASTVIDSDTSQMEIVEPVKEQVFNIDSFSFGYSVEEIRVKQGDVVTINLTNSNGFHDWVVDEFAVATKQISVGEKASVTFVADKKGVFEYYCSVGNHRAQGMVGTLIVE